MPGRSFLLVVSSLVGIVAGLAAVALKVAIHEIQHFFTQENFADNLLQLAYPLMGLILTLMAGYLMRLSHMGHAIADVLYAISKKSGLIERANTYARLITCSLTVGFGGSLGAESPIVMTGAAIGSNLASALNLGYKIRTLMIGCGTAAVISAIFNAPITGLIFSIEVILIEVSITNFIPLLVASVSAALVSLVLVGDDVLFSFKLYESYALKDVFLSVPLGMFCAGVALYFNRSTHAIAPLFDYIRDPVVRAVTGGLLLSLLIFLCPPVFGEGYPSIIALMNNLERQLIERAVFSAYLETPWAFVCFLAFVILVKPVASATTLGAGGSGGTFAPSLFLGGVSGFLFARLCNLLELANVSEPNFALLGMCGMICGVQYAPLTAIFLIAEITGGYSLFVPLMAVSAVTYVTVTYFAPHSPYMQDLMRRGHVAFGNYDRKVLSSLSIEHLVEQDFHPVQDKAYLGDLVQLISVSRRNIFPVVDMYGGLVGIVTLDHVREIMFDPQKQQNIPIRSLMERPPAIVVQGEGMEEVMSKFEKTDAWNLPVTDKVGGYVGFVSKSRIFDYYRRQLMNQ